MRNAAVITRLRKLTSAKAELTADQQVWVHVFAALAGATLVDSTDTCVKWADKAVERFNERFGGE